MTKMRARYRRILRFELQTFLSIWWFDVALPRIGLRSLAERSRKRRLVRTAVRFRALAIDLGGLMIKVGQFMSSRLDVLPPEITKELEGLQDEVPAASFAGIRELAEAELGMPLDRVFEYVEETPIAAASLGQAHRARLRQHLSAEAGFTDAVLKVQRPGISDIVAVDLRALRKVAGWVARIRAVAERVDARALVEEFAQTSLEELDYAHEAASSERFAANAAADRRVTVPLVAWEHSTRRVLTLQDVTAIKISDVAALEAADIDPHDVALAFAGVMFDQVFTSGFFHADPHPGNVFVKPDGQGGWAFAFIDFGMMGEVPDTIRSGLRHALVAAAGRDGAGLVHALGEVGVLLPTANTHELERVMRTLFARFGGMGMAELREVDPRELKDFADQFGTTIRSLPFQLPENFLLLVRAMSLVSGVCSTLDREFNLWDAVEPYAAALIREERGRAASEVGRAAVEMATTSMRLPARIDRFITTVEDGRMRVDLTTIDRRIGRLELLGRRLFSSVVFAALLVAGALVRADDAVLGSVLMAISAVPLLYTLVAGWFGRAR